MSHANLTSTFGRWALLSVLSVAVLVHASDIRAEDLVGDAQTHARNLLSGNRLNGSAKPEASITRADDAVRALDAQAHARQLLSGKPNLARTAVSHAAATPSVQVRGPNSRGADAQEMARLFILGKAG
jgi:hypothetical protein